MRCTWSPECLYPPDGPAVASWECQNGNVVYLCQGCLDMWFDNADDDEALEPTSWALLAERIAA